MKDELKRLEDEQTRDHDISQSEIDQFRTELTDLDAKREAAAEASGNRDEVLSKAKNRSQENSKEHDAAKKAVEEAERVDAPWTVR